MGQLVNEIKLNLYNICTLETREKKNRNDKTGVM
jgi:hypothetical protein